MARIDTLEHFLSDVADSIRTKTGKSGDIQCSEFNTEIGSIPTGGHNVNIYVQSTEPSNKDGLWINTNAAYSKYYLCRDPLNLRCISSPIMPNSWYERPAVQLNGLIYIFGGQYGGSSQNGAYTFDPTRQLFAGISNLPIYAYGVGAVAYNNSIYLFGGRNGNATYDSVYKYNPTNNTYTLISTMPEKLGQFGITINEGIVYIVGGTSNGGSVRKNTLYSYDIDNDTWSTLSSIPTARNCTSVECINGYLYAFGGYDNNPYKTSYKYNISSNTWTSIEDFPIAIFGLVHFKVGNFIYLFGGCAGNAYYKNAYLYDTLSDKYIRLDDLPITAGRAYLSIAQYNNTYYLFGGQTSSGNTAGSNSILIINVSDISEYTDNSLLLVNESPSHNILLSNDIYYSINKIYKYSTTENDLITDISNICYYGNGTQWIHL